MTIFRRDPVDKLDDEFAIAHFHAGGFAYARSDLLREAQGEAVTPLQNANESL